MAAAGICLFIPAGIWVFFYMGHRILGADHVRTTRPYWQGMREPVSMTREQIEAVMGRPLPEVA
jgi:hypothetical protein